MKNNNTKPKEVNKIKTFQLAVDLIDLKTSLKLLDEVGEYIDIIELGTPLIISEGLSIISVVKKLYPDKIIFADLKIMDGGFVISDLAYKKGADMISVLGAANDKTVEAVIDRSRKGNKMVLVDMCAVKNLQKRAKEIDILAPDYISVHRASDMQSYVSDPLKDLKLIENIQSRIAVAGGITLENFELVCQSSVDNIIVGGGIYNSSNPKEITAKMRDIIDKYQE
ncbi:MAG TPA: 3-hexulose-6-phosphate synthase [Halanaerobiales bacterium]|nr:3-hexulose-6-phosphate synthase [Halanaerobiales bacterium]